MMSPHSLSRRAFLAAATTGAMAASQTLGARPAPRNEICAFVKFLQTLDYRMLARTIADLGFDGIEGTVRDKGPRTGCRRTSQTG